MPDRNPYSGSPVLAFIVGGLVVAIVVVGWVVYSGGLPQADQPDIKIEVPGVGSIEGEAKPAD